AAEALASHGNPTSLGPLMDALQHVNRAETSFERLRGVGADNPDALLKALAGYGMPMHWNNLAKRWVKGVELLAGPNTGFPDD
ncbi:MAG: hypothetical protein H7338_24645, partial [Candidatus Sericytochromatia bacterium]|nr:hypothetical protein [Candidatus Sericytochromatia bacterium]